MLERLLTDERDLFAGFGAFEGDRGETIQRIHERGRAKSVANVEAIARSRDEE